MAVAEFIVETMGLIPMGFLCIFLRKYMLAVLTVGGGKQKSAIRGDSSPSVLNFCKVSLTIFVTSGV